MTRVCTFNDLEARDASNRSQGYGMTYSQNVHDRVGPQNIREALFHGFSWKTFIFAIMVVQVIAFFVELGVDLNGFHFANAVGDKTLSILGAFHWPLIKRGHVYRFLSSSLYNYTFLSLVLSLLAHAFVGFRIEHELKTAKFVIFYVTTGILSLLCTGVYEYNEYIVGSFPQCCAMIGLFMAEDIAFRKEDDIIELYYFRIFFYVMFTVPLLVPIGGVIRLAEFSGLVVGAVVSLLFNYNKKDECKYYPYILATLSAVYLGLLIWSLTSILL